MDNIGNCEYYVVVERDDSAYRLSEAKEDGAEWNGDNPFMTIACTCAAEVANLSPAIGLIRDKKTKSTVGWLYANNVDWGVRFFEHKKDLLAELDKYGCAVR
jgi:hypothetical protein